MKNYKLIITTVALFGASTITHAATAYAQEDQERSLRHAFELVCPTEAELEKNRMQKEKLHPAMRELSETDYRMGVCRRIKDICEASAGAPECQREMREQIELYGASELQTPTPPSPPAPSPRPNPRNCGLDRAEFNHSK